MTTAAELAKAVFPPMPYWSDEVAAQDHQFSTKLATAFIAVYGDVCEPTNDAHRATAKFLMSCAHNASDSSSPADLHKAMRENVRHDQTAAEQFAALAAEEAAYPKARW